MILQKLNSLLELLLSPILAFIMTTPLLMDLIVNYVLTLKTILSISFSKLKGK